MNEYAQHRRGYGGNTRLDPLVGKSSSIAGVPPRSSKPKNLMSQSLLKSNNMHGNSQKNSSKSILNKREKETKVKTPVRDERIIIKVTDERKKINKNFEWKKSILLREMKYFEKHLKSSDSAEDIDISVHWDVAIFEWLMNYIKERGTTLTKQNVIPILISAEFLVIRKLIGEWIGFIIDHITEIAKGPIDLSCLSQSI